MKLDFDSFPLSVYSRPTAQRVLRMLGLEVPMTTPTGRSVAQSLLESYVRKASGMGLLFLIDNLSIGRIGKKAREALATLSREQISKVSVWDEHIRREAQINLMATYGVTSYLSHLECSSWGNGVTNIGKSILGLFDKKSPMETIWDSTAEISENYRAIAHLYHVAFLLELYECKRGAESYVKSLIREALGSDASGEKSVSSKKRPLLFSDCTFLTLEENMSSRPSLIKEAISRAPSLSIFLSSYLQS